MTGNERPVTICVPVYNAADFVRETLSSIRGQTRQDFTVLVSVDASTDESVAICREFSADERVRVFEQSRCLGWVGNCNWLLERVTSPYLCLIPHDDLVEPFYIERLFALAESHPEAAVVYSDIHTFGGPAEATLVQDPLSGPRRERVLKFLTEHYDAVAFRGLVRTEATRGGGLLQSNPLDDFAADSVWVMKLATRGELQRLPEALYWKRYGHITVHGEWSTWSRDKKVRAWTHHCLEVGAIAFAGETQPRQQSTVLHALAFRLLRRDPRLGPYEEISRMEDGERREVLSIFLSLLACLVGRKKLASVIRQAARLPLEGETWHEPLLAEVTPRLS